MTRKALTLPGWVIISSAIVCLGAAVLYAALVLGDAAPAAPGPTATTSTAPTPSDPPITTPTDPPSSTPSEPSDATPSPTATPPAPEPSDAVRDRPVDVYNNTSTTGLAKRVAAKAAAAGWTIHTTSNWRGTIPASTVYYPPGLESQAQTLADDLGVGRIRAAVAPMSGERLTVILSGQQ